ncbi:putative amine oxidase [Candidatus Vecturithrix granuli]|uniref:Putative amine oxidase n=1 Tax=Vecturithrix granuli TaxID=1499967 RepID=A0A081C5S6_VECG1|nr:putative amine oxidase [Candidatus Vecturithrix granuli]
MTQTTILGAGLTGLSAAYHLRDGYEIFEQEAEVGGLCRTMKRKGFLFDYTGHLLHLRHDYTKHLIQTLLPNLYQQHERKAVIYTQGRYLNYPFQANISSLPPEIIKECIIGFVETLNKADCSAPDAANSFHDWVLHTFGSGIAKYFMFPYNQKLWRTPLDQLAADWVSWSIPKPTLDEFLNGALGIKNRAFGYNPTFLYPKSGGTEQLPQALAACLHPDHLHCRKKAIAIEAETRLIRFEDRSICSYDQLISTLPLSHLLHLLQPLPEEIKQTAESLRYISVYDVNIGVKRPHISDAHWIYFPEPEYLFYRVGFPMNFSSAAVPEGCSSIYVEVSVLPEEVIPEQTLLEKIYDGLQRSGILRNTDDILTADIVRIECAYVIHDLCRPQALHKIIPYLAQQQIYSVGRYGAWEYNSMEGAILAGKQIAERLSGVTDLKA